MSTRACTLLHVHFGSVFHDILPRITHLSMSQLIIAKGFGGEAKHFGGEAPLPTG